MLHFISALCIISIVLLQHGKSSVFQRRNSNEDCNEYIDKLLEDTMAENRHKLEPYRPGNTTFGFEQKVVFITVSGKVELHEMTVSGISTIHRDGDCQRSSADGVSKISVSLGMGVLQLNSKARVSFMDYGMTVDLTGKIGYVLVHLEASRDDNAGTPPSIDDFRIYETTGESAEISGLGPFNYIANTITSVFIRLFKTTILHNAEKRIAIALDEMIKTSDFPLFE